MIEMIVDSFAGGGGASTGTRELSRAQGFPESYIIDRKPDGSPISKTEQVSKCGNSVCPPMAAALVAANYSPREVEPAPRFMEAAE